jgi:hypothetical protein
MSLNLPLFAYSPFENRVRLSTPAALDVEADGCNHKCGQGGSFRWHQVMAIVKQEVEREVSPSVESKFEKAEGKGAQKEYYVVSRESFPKGLGLSWIAQLGVPRVIAAVAKRL